MNLRAIRADAAYVLRNWARARSTVVVSLGMPLILLVSLGTIVQPTAPGAPVVEVVDHAGTPEARGLVEALLASDAFAAVERDAAAARASDFRASGAHARVEISAEFTGAPEGVRILTGEGSAALADALVATVGAALARPAAQDDADAGGVVVEEVPLPEAPPYAAFLLPGVMGLTVLMAGLPAGYGSVVELRHAGLLERLAVSPMTKTEWLLARMIGASVIALAAAVVLVVAAWLTLGVQPRITPWTLLLVVSGTLIFSGLGVLLGTSVKNPSTGGAVVNLALLPLVMLSGSFFEVERLPAVLGKLSFVSPLTHLNRGLRADMLGGDGTTVALHALGLALAAGALLVVGARLVSWHARD